MKKIIAFIMTMTLVLSSLVTTAFAQADVVIKGDKEVYDLAFEKDKTFDVTFMIENNSEVTNGDFSIKYDPTVIQAVENTDMSTDGFFGYEAYGTIVPFVPTTVLNEAINFVPSSKTTDVYEGKSDDVKTEAEIGIIKLSLVAYDASGLKLIDMKDGKFLTIRFKMVGEGSTSVNLTKAHPNDRAILFRDADQALSVEISPVTVNLTATASDTTEVTTVSSNTVEDNNVTTTEATTQVTTEVTTEKATEVTEVPAEETTELAVILPVEVKTFDDIAAYPWAKTAIETLATEGIINGVGDNKFNPSANVKRADFLLMLMNALEIEGEAKSTFSDVDENMYYANAVCLAKDLGIANGKGNNEFAPNEMISRQDMMVLASNAIKTKLELENASTDVLDKFSDKAEISAYAQAPLAQMVNAGIVNGTGSKIEPKANTTRAQAAVIIYNIYNKINQ